MLFETAHMVAYKVDHSAELRVGFYFKDLEVYPCQNWIFIAEPSQALAVFYQQVDARPD